MHNALHLGIFVAEAGAFVTVVDEVLNSSGYKEYQNEIGYLGIVAQACTIVGMILAGRWVDLTKAF